MDCSVGQSDSDIGTLRKHLFGFHPALDRVIGILLQGYRLSAYVLPLAGIRIRETAGDLAAVRIARSEGRRIHMPHRLVAQRLSRVLLETSFCKQIDPRLIPVEVGTHQENVPCRHGMRDDKPQFVVFVEPRVNIGSIKRIAILIHDDLLARPISFGRGCVPVNDGPLID